MLKSHIFYLELSAKTQYYSLNYERIFRQGPKLSYSLRLGFSKLPDDISLPIAINVFSSKGAHHVEGSLNFIPYAHNYRTMVQFVDLSERYLHIAPGAGYRYQKPGGKVFVSSGVTLVVCKASFPDDSLVAEGKFNPFARVAVGICF